MANKWIEYVTFKKKLIERCNNAETKLETIKKLQKVPITIELLQETGIGKVMKHLCKENGRIGENANVLLTKWKDIVALKYRSANKQTESAYSEKSLKKMDSKSHDSSKSKKSSNPHMKSNGVLSSKQLYKSNHEHPGYLVASRKEQYKDSGFYDEDSAPHRTVKVESLESYTNGTQFERFTEEDDIPYNSEMSKYTSYSDHVHFDVNEYNPEFPTIDGKKYKPEINKNHEPANQDFSASGSENDTSSEKECDESDSPRTNNGSPDFVKNKSVSSRWQYEEESESLDMQSKHQPSNYIQNGSSSFKTKYEGRAANSSSRGKHGNEPDAVVSSKYKEKETSSVVKDCSSKSLSPNGKLHLKRKHCELDKSSTIVVKLKATKHHSSNSDHHNSVPPAKRSEKHHSEHGLQQHKKLKVDDISKVSGISSKVALENGTLKSDSKCSSFKKNTPKDNDKIMKISEKHKDKLNSSHKDKLKEGGKLHVTVNKTTSKTTNKTVNKTTNKTVNKKDSISLEVEGFTATEASFEDCLGFNDMVSVKKKKSSAKPGSSPVPPKDKVSKPSEPKVSSKNTGSSPVPPKDKVLKPSERKVSSKNTALGDKTNSTNHVKNAEPSKTKISSKESKDLSKDKNKIKKKSTEMSASFAVPKPPEVEVDIMSTLPEIQPNYRPLPSRPDTPPHKRTVMTNEEAIRFTTSRKEKTAVYSGRKNNFITEVGSLYDMCIRVLVENIDDIGPLNGVPYMLLKPILQHCNPKQLYSIEDFNAYLLEDTGELWEKHCMRKYRNQRPEPGETWRDLFIRLHDEQESRLKSVTRNISVSMSRATPVRQTKLAYVDSVVKPPRDVARKQAKHGTGLPVNHSMKGGPPSKASPRPTAIVINVAASPKHSSPFTSSGNSAAKALKHRTAPLMMKTLKDFKNTFRR